MFSNKRIASFIIMKSGFSNSANFIEDTLRFSLNSRMTLGFYDEIILSNYIADLYSNLAS